MTPTPEQIAEALAEEREADTFVTAQWQAADEWLDAEWLEITDRERAIARSAWTELCRQQAAPGFVLVPIEPTATMLTALWNGRDVGAPVELKDAYAAMLATVKARNPQ